MFKALAGTAVTTLTALGLLASSGVADASAVEKAPPLRITRVQYDSPGSDTGTNRSLNAEWVRISNFGHKRRALTGFTLRDPQGHVYRFPHFVLGIGRSVVVHTGNGRNTQTNLYWREDNYVWNNDGDRAIFKTRSGRVLDTCSWGDGSGVTSC